MILKSFREGVNKFILYLSVFWLLCPNLILTTTVIYNRSCRGSRMWQVTVID